jgi:peptidylprolyl isomerase
MATKVEFQTTQGNFTIELYDEAKPITVGNFLKLVKDGFYNGLVFHRIIANFMIQGGCPKGNGTGGPGYKIKDEFTQPQKNNYGTIAMANAGPNTGGSQFFINVNDNNYLDKGHPVFGKVIKGMNIVQDISDVKTDRMDRPLVPIKVEKISILTE